MNQFNDKNSFVFVDSKSELTEAQIKYHTRRLGAYAVELASLSSDSTYRYVFFIKKRYRRTLAEKKRLLSSIVNWKMNTEPVCYHSMEYIVYYHISRRQLPEKERVLEEQGACVRTYLKEHEGTMREAFTDCYAPADKDPYRQLRLAVLYASRNKAILLVTDMQKLLLDSDFYDVLYEGSCEVAAIGFPLMCRQNLPMMRAMALYRESSNR